MFRSLLLSAAFMVGAGAMATTIPHSAVLVKVAKKALMVSPMARFTVGDTNNYELTVAGTKGTIVMTITSVDAKGVMIDQTINIMGQTQDAQELINPMTGEVIEMTVNGQKQTPPDPNNTEIISESLATITVPAGTFNCQDVKLHNKKENTDGEQWMDMNDVPVGGMLKMTTTEQGLDIMAELTSFSMGTAKP